VSALALLIEAGPLGIEGRGCWLTRQRLVRLVVEGCAVFVRGRYVVTVRGHERAEQARQAA
jgi:hypothetical protein